MRTHVYYGARGSIVSVIQIPPEAGLTPSLPDHDCIEVDLEALRIDSLAELHANYRVKGDGQLVRREPAKRRPKAKA
jgi:hypothetical protein